MMGIQPSQREPALFSYHIDLEQRIPADHLLRQVRSVLDLSFVLPIVGPLYGRSGHVSLDPRGIMKILLLLFLYNIPSERELMEQIRVRLDFLWFLDFDLDTPIPNHSVLSKARARWGGRVFEQLFVRMVEQCVQAGLVDGSLLHVDSTIVKAQASRASVVSASPELVSALRQAYQQQQAKLEVLPEPQASPEAGNFTTPSPVPAPVAPAAAQEREGQNSPAAPTETKASPLPSLPVLRAVPQPQVQPSEPAKVVGKKLPVNSTHISTTDPEAQLARNKSGVTQLNYKEHRLVDDTHGVVTAVKATSSTTADGSQLVGLYEQHLGATGLKLAQVTVAGDHHYGTASNYLYCAQKGLRAHLGEVSANLEERGVLPLERFVYEPEQDRLRCPAGHHLVLHQNRPEEQSKVYLIEDPAHCAGCALHAQCTKSKRGRSIQRHVQAELVEAARAQANSPTARYSRKRRRHVMEGSFADAFNNHGASKARWRGLGRQQIQSWLIAAVQNLRILLRHPTDKPAQAAAMAVLGQLGRIELHSLWGQLARHWAALKAVWLLARVWNLPQPGRFW